MYAFQVDRWVYVGLHISASAVRNWKANNRAYWGKAMNSFYKNKRKKGYSLAEVLVTVTILLILMAIFGSTKVKWQKGRDN